MSIETTLHTIKITHDAFFSRYSIHIDDAPAQSFGMPAVATGAGILTAVMLRHALALADSEWEVAFDLTPRMATELRAARRLETHAPFSLIAYTSQISTESRIAWQETFRAGERFVSIQWLPDELAARRAEIDAQCAMRNVSAIAAAARREQYTSKLQPVEPNPTPIEPAAPTSEVAK